VLSVVAVSLILVVATLSSSGLGDILLRAPAEARVDIGDLGQIVRAGVALQEFIDGSEGFPSSIVTEDSLLTDEGLELALEVIVGSFLVNATVVVRDHLLDVTHC